ncbi:unnamed protein product [Lactuca virosa]|uniref:Dirigent protein n=1 Tax=Lactuca virosa TaxID=75947 RepID=A0AAU9M717_9ASTR|nr:unnamed protein product [Lactuca virosa]
MAGATKVRRLASHVDVVNGNNREGVDGALVDGNNRYDYGSTLEYDTVDGEYGDWVISCLTVADEIAGSLCTDDIFHYHAMIDGNALDSNFGLIISQEQKFNIRDIAPEFGSASESTKVLIIGKFTCDSYTSKNKWYYKWVISCSLSLPENTITATIVSPCSNIEICTTLFLVHSFIRSSSTFHQLPSNTRHPSQHAIIHIQPPSPNS